MARSRGVRPRGSDAPDPTLRLIDLVGEARDAAIPILKESFTGYYRWHAKRTLREIAEARAAVRNGTIAGVALLEPLLPQVGYVYYLFVARTERRRGIGGRLLDDAIRRFRRSGAVIVYAAAETENRPSVRLLESRGFRATARKELGWQDGGMGAWGLRSRMRVIGGEVLFGLRLDGVVSRPERTLPVRGRSTERPDRPELPPTVRAGSSGR
jgi:ribosomal protein S18 acetylase RimI-like enzyme